MYTYNKSYFNLPCISVRVCSIFNGALSDIALCKCLPWEGTNSSMYDTSYKTTSQF